MICQTCYGRGMLQCPDCIGGIVYCCDGIQEQPIEPSTTREVETFEIKDCVFEGPIIIDKAPVPRLIERFPMWDPVWDTEFELYGERQKSKE
jgi:hypothetical protein